MLDVGTVPITLNDFLVTATYDCYLNRRESTVVELEMTRATITSWKTLPPPEQREPLGFTAEFTDAETELLVFGLIPREMEDKWFICLHQGWLLFHRSWTGACIYGLRLEAVRGGARVTDSWVSRDPAQHKGVDVGYDRKLVRFLIDALLLRRE